MKNKSSNQFIDIKKAVKSFTYASNGIGDLVRTENNFKLHLVSALIVIAMGFYFKITKTEWLLLILFIGIVLAAEAFNSAIEYLSDKFNSDFDPAIGKVKDISAGAVLIVSIAALIGGIIIFYNYISSLL